MNYYTRKITNDGRNVHAGDNLLIIGLDRLYQECVNKLIVVLINDVKPEAIPLLMLEYKQHYYLGILKGAIACVLNLASVDKNGLNPFVEEENQQVFVWKTLSKTESHAMIQATYREMVRTATGKEVEEMSYRAFADYITNEIETIVIELLHEHCGPFFPNKDNFISVWAATNNSRSDICLLIKNS